MLLAEVNSDKKLRGARRFYDNARDAAELNVEYGDNSIALPYYGAHIHSVYLDPRNEYGCRLVIAVWSELLFYGDEDTLPEPDYWYSIRDHKGTPILNNIPEPSTAELGFFAKVYQQFKD